jgi:hypothetical protein
VELKLGSIETPLLREIIAPHETIDDIMRLDQADREILERVLDVRKIFDLDDVIRLLRSEIERAGSQRAFARKAGVNVSVVSRTLNRQRLPSEKVLRALKLRAAYFSK